MTIHCQCEHCGASLKVKDKLAGTVGKCPKCRKKIHIPESVSDESEDMLLTDESPRPQTVAPRKTAEEEEEDAIFGDDFFNMQEPSPRPRYVPPVFPDDDEEEETSTRSRKSKSAQSAPAKGATAADSNAASIASSLLSKTGKRNRPEDYKEPEEDEDEGYDFSEIKYLLINRVLPGAGAAIVFFGLFYWLFSDMMGGGLELPELAELTGRVTNNGEGVAAQLIFLPRPDTPGSAASGSSSAAVSNPDGTYEVFYKDDIPGLVIGQHEVRINAGTVRVVREVTIEAGSQEIDFELSQ